MSLFTKVDQLTTGLNASQLRADNLTILLTITLPM